MGHQMGDFGETPQPERQGQEEQKIERSGQKQTEEPPAPRTQLGPPNQPGTFTSVSGNSLMDHGRYLTTTRDTPVLIDQTLTHRITPREGGSSPPAGLWRTIFADTRDPDYLGYVAPSVTIGTGAVNDFLRVHEICYGTSSPGPAQLRLVIETAYLCVVLDRSN